MRVFLKLKGVSVSLHMPWPHYPGNILISWYNHQDLVSYPPLGHSHISLANQESNDQDWMQTPVPTFVSALQNQVLPVGNPKRSSDKPQIILALTAEPGALWQLVCPSGTLSTPKTLSPRSSFRLCFVDSAPALTLTTLSWTSLLQFSLNTAAKLTSQDTFSLSHLQNNIYIIIFLNMTSRLYCIHDKRKDEA